MCTCVYKYCCCCPRQVCWSLAPASLAGQHSLGLQSGYPLFRTSYFALTYPPQNPQRQKTHHNTNTTAPPSHRRRQANYTCRKHLAQQQQQRQQKQEQQQEHNSTSIRVMVSLHTRLNVASRSIVLCACSVFRAGGIGKIDVIHAILLGEARRRILWRERPIGTNHTTTPQNKGSTKEQCANKREGG